MPVGLLDIAQSDQGDLGLVKLLVVGAVVVEEVEELVFGSGL